MILQKLRLLCIMAPESESHITEPWLQTQWDSDMHFLQSEYAPILYDWLQSSLPTHPRLEARAVEVLEQMYAFFNGVEA